MKLGKISAVTPKRLSKSFTLMDGKITKENGGALVRGNIEILTVGNVTALADVIRTLGPSNALTFGVPAKNGKVVSRSQAQAHPDAITRTRENFQWPDGDGIMLLDYDPAPNSPALTFTELWTRLALAAPSLMMAPCVAVPSASSCVHSTNGGTEYTGIRGWHIFVIVADAQRIPEFGETLTSRLWRAGLGYIAISKSGALMERTLIDASVWQPERLSFDGGSECGPGLVQQRLAHLQTFNQDATPLADFPAPNAKELRDVKKSINDAKRALKPEMEKAQTQWVDDRVAEAIDKDPALDSDIVRATYQTALDRSELMADFVLTTADGSTVTVGEMLADAARWDRAHLRDPREPDYNGNAACARAYLSQDRPTIHSFAHGGATYVLRPQPENLKLDENRWPEIVDKCVNALARDLAVYDRGGALSAIDASGTLFGATTHWLCTALERRFNITKYDARAGDYIAARIPLEMAQRIVAAKDVWTFPPLIGVCDHRIIDTENNVVTTPGYHAGTKLYIHADRAKWRPIPRDLKQAVATLMHPVSLMPFASPADAGAALAMLLTAIVRPAIPEAPAFIVSSTTFGSGKSYLSTVAALLAGGNIAVGGYTHDDEEQEKRLAAMLLQGSPSIVLDNASGAIGGDVLARLLTQDTFTARRLGTNEMLRLPARVVLVINGVNIGPSADMVRRALTIRLDPGIEHPEAKKFPFDPTEWTGAHLEDMRAASLCILQAASPHGLRLGNYAEWVRMVLDAVLTVRDSGAAECEIGNPLDTMQRSRAEDPEAEQVEAFLSGWHARVADSPMLVSDFIQLVFNAPGDTDTAIYRGRLIEIAGARGAVDPNRLAMFMRRHAGRVLGGLYLKRGVKRHSGIAWQVLEAKSATESLELPNFSYHNRTVKEFINVDDSYRARGGAYAIPATPSQCERCGGEGCRYCSSVLAGGAA